DYILAALANGISTILQPGLCDDTARMQDALQRLGINMSSHANSEIKITGSNGRFNRGIINLDVGFSATSTRFLIALSALRSDSTTIDGHPSMQARPNKYLLDALIDLGAIVYSTNDGYLPLSIQCSENYAKSLH